MELTIRKSLQRLRSLPPASVRRWWSPVVRRWIWRALTAASLGLVSIGLFYAWRDLPTTEVQLALVYLIPAVAIYGVTYLMHTLGWHRLARHFFGSITLRENAEAVAASNLVKYLPTVAWYIANRTEYYQQRGVPRRLVVAASLCELVAMVGVGALLYLLGETMSYSVVLASGLLLVAVGVVVSAGRSRGLLHQWVRHRFRVERTNRVEGEQLGWLAALGWYGGTWPLGVLFLAAILRVFTPVSAGDIWALANVWLLAGLASYAVSLTLGSLGIAREITLTYLLAQVWPLHIAVATAIVVKIVLTLGEVVCSLTVLAALWLARRRKRE
jgi:hypothetical protein